MKFSIFAHNNSTTLIVTADIKYVKKKSSLIISMYIHTYIYSSN